MKDKKYKYKLEEKQKKKQKPPSFGLGGFCFKGLILKFLRFILSLA
jgi:hypothetical protein